MSANDQERGWLAILLRTGTVATALAAILGLLFLVFPKLKPMPPEPTKKLGVTLTDLQVEHSGSFHDSNSVVIRFKAQIEGYQDKVLPLMWTLYNSNTGKSYGAFDGLLGPGPPWRGWPTPGFKPTAQSESFSGEIRVPIPFGGVTWKVRLEITDPNGKPLERVDTKPFDVAQ